MQCDFYLEIHRTKFRPFWFKSPILTLLSFGCGCWYCGRIVQTNSCRCCGCNGRLNSRIISETDFQRQNCRTYHYQCCRFGSVNDYHHGNIRLNKFYPNFLDRNRTYSCWSCGSSSRRCRSWHSCCLDCSDQCSVAFSISFSWKKL